MIEAVDEGRQQTTGAVEPLCGVDPELREHGRSRVPLSGANRGESGHELHQSVRRDTAQATEQTGSATEQTEAEVAAAPATARGSRQVLDGIAATVRDMHEQVVAIASAVDGSGIDDLTGLAQLAELLRHEVTNFLGELRA